MEAAVAPSPQKRIRASRSSPSLGTLLVYAALLLACAFALAPLLWAISTSLKASGEILAYPPTLLPRTWTLEHYLAVLTVTKMPRYLLNSTIVAAISIAFSLAVASPLAYVAAHFQFPLKPLILYVVLATAMIPGISILVPLYLLSRRLGIHDTYLVLVLIYSAWMVPQVVWLLRGFFESVPPELEQAARIDGCSRLAAFRLVVLPLVRPGLAAAGILIFIYVWNDFLIAVAMTASESMRLTQVGLARYISDVGVSWGEFMAYTVLITLPPVLAFAALQRRFIQALISGAVKG